MARALLLKSAQLKTLPESAGPAVVATGAAGASVFTPEVWGVPGVWSMPPDGTHGVQLPVGGSARFSPVIATHHYKTPRPTLAKGETALGSTSADGATVKALIVAKTDGTLSATNAAEDAATLIGLLFDKIIGIQTVGSPSNHVLDPATITELTTLKGRFQTLFSEGVI